MATSTGIGLVANATDISPFHSGVSHDLVTQFITADGTDTGPLTEIRRHYKQNGVTIPSPTVYLGGKSYDSITSDFCDGLQS